ncbi:TIGR01666 family membrane protein, partial [Pseudomonas syringae pv. tagetis]
ELSTSLENMLMEHGHFLKEADVGFRFLLLSHTLLSYLSCLGAHSDNKMPSDVHVHLIYIVGATLTASSADIAAGLAEKS